MRNLHCFFRYLFDSIILRNSRCNNGNTLFYCGLPLLWWNTKNNVKNNVILWNRHNNVKDNVKHAEQALDIHPVKITSKIMSNLRNTIDNGNNNVN